MIRPPPRSTLFPYPTLFQSVKFFVGQEAREQGTEPRPGHAQQAEKLERPRRIIQQKFDAAAPVFRLAGRDRKSTRLNSSHLVISYAVFCLKNKNSKSHSILH